jgi:hypothetical protein
VDVSAARPEWALLDKILSGVEISVGEDHVDNPVGEKPRARYEGSQAVLNGLIQDLVKAGQGFILRRELVQHEQGVCMGAVHAADKGPTKDGRLIWDSPLLNSAELVKKSYRC